MRRRLALAPATVAVASALTACAGSGPGATARDDGRVATALEQPARGVEGRSVCALLDPGVVGRSVGQPGLRARAHDSPDPSICTYTAGRVRVRVALDGAAQAQRRFYNELSETLQLFPRNGAMRPRAVRHVGDDAAYGGAGAFWTRGRDQLVAYAADRIVRTTVYLPGQPPRRLEAAAVRMTRRLIARVGP